MLEQVPKYHRSTNYLCALFVCFFNALCYTQEAGRVAAAAEERKDRYLPSTHWFSPLSIATMGAMGPKTSPWPYCRNCASVLDRMSTLTHSYPFLPRAAGQPLWKNSSRPYKASHNLLAVSWLLFDAVTIGHMTEKWAVPPWTIVISSKLIVDHAHSIFMMKCNEIPSFTLLNPAAWP